MRDVAAWAMAFKLPPETVWDTPYEMLGALEEAHAKAHGKPYSRRLDEDEALKKEDALAWFKAQHAKRQGTVTDSAA